MKLKEFLYRLHRSESISKEETKEMQETIASVPYLGDLDSKGIYQQDSYSDVNNQLHSIAHEEYVSNLNSEDILLPFYHEQSIESNQPINSKSDNPANSDHITTHINDANIGLSGKIDPFKDRFKKELYQAEESEFVKYLNSLPLCCIPIEKNPVEQTAVNSIENKIKNTPDIHRETDELIKSSLDLNQGISSESLANLWAKQGRPDLAIQMYEKLAVEYPEKSATFAVKIEKLKTDNSL
jgi:hypothetical protein